MSDFYKKSISLDSAERLAHAAINRANELGFAIGVSGSHYENDQECAKAALNSIK
jgi:uncharacterized protein GlcG (DUF336 family)